MGWGHYGINSAFLDVFKGPRGLYMLWDPYFRHYLSFWHAFLHLRLRTLDFFEILAWIFLLKIRSAYTLPHCAPRVFSNSKSSWCIVTDAFNIQGSNSNLLSVPDLFFATKTERQSKEFKDYHQFCVAMWATKWFITNVKSANSYLQHEQLNGFSSSCWIMWLQIIKF